MNKKTTFGRLSGGAKLLLLAVAFLAAATRPALGQSEEGVKAAFVYNFAKFTAWPDGAFAGASAPVTVGFVGADALADKFQQVVTGKNANGRDFVIKKLSGAAEAADCQIVYVGDASQAAAVVGATKGKPVLTLGESDGFVSAGGMVNFMLDGGKVVFDLDLNVVNANGLKVDTKLRQVARSVKGG
jgi:hypothetical protein